MSIIKPVDILNKSIAELLKLSINITNLDDDKGINITDIKPEDFKELVDNSHNYQLCSSDKRVFIKLTYDDNSSLIINIKHI